MKELNVKNKLGLRVFVSDTPHFEQIPKQDIATFIETLAKNYEESLDKKLKADSVKTVDFKDTT